ncbi:MAG: hypothetical protein M3Y59_02805 [Myxococcota bacterium]|nr:hypothetical protein [Myxococcota bacterium]
MTNQSEFEEAVSLLTAGVASKAIPILEDLAQKDPASWQVVHALARAVDMEGDQPRAQQLLTQAHRLAPSEPEPACDLAMFLLATEQDEAAWQVLEPALAAHPGHPRVNLQAAMAQAKSSPSRARVFAGQALETGDPEIQDQARALYGILAAQTV